MTINRKRVLNLGLLLAAVAAAFACYSNTLHMWLYGDDSIYIAGKIQDLQQGLRTYLANSPDRPLLMASIWVDFKLAGNSIPFFRGTTIVLHALTCFALFHLLFLLGRKHLNLTKPWLPALLALAYLVHPVHTQAIQIVCQRCVVMTAFFSLVALYCFLRFIEDGDRTRYRASLVAYVLAIASKANSIALVPILLLYIFGFCRERFKPLAKELVPFLLAGLLPVIYYPILGANRQNAMAWHEYLKTQLQVVFTYFRLFAAPIHLHYLYDVDTGKSWADAQVLAALGGHLAILAATARLWLKRRERLLAFSVFAVYLALLPESSIFPIRYPMWEYRTYFPLAFLMIGVLWLFERAGKRRPLLVGLLVALLPLAVFADRQRNAEVETHELWAMHTLKYNPHHYDYNTRLLASMLDLENMAWGPKAAMLIHEANPSVMEYELYAIAFDYLASPKDKRDKTKLLAIGGRLLSIDEFPISETGRLALDNFIYRHLSESLSGIELYESLEELSFPQVVMLARLRMNGREAMRFFKNYSVTLNQLKQHCEEKPADEARCLGVLVKLGVLYGQPTPSLDRQYDEYLKRHPNDTDARAMYEWYKTSFHDR